MLAFGAGTANGDNWSDIDFMDLNGDRYPDIVGGGSVQPTLPNGALDDARLGTGAFGVLSVCPASGFELRAGCFSEN